MTSRLPLGRTVATCVGVFFLGVAAYFFFLSYVNRAYFWHPARFGCLAAISVDLSTPGTYTASFDYGQPIHNGFLGLDVPERILSNTSPDVLLAGLQGTYAIFDADGKQFIKGPLVEDPNRIRTRYYQKIIELRDLGDWYGRVKWKINATIIQGAPNLKGIPHRLVFIDSEPVFRLRIARLLYTFIICAALLVGVVILTIITRITLWKRKRPENSKVL